MNKGSSTNFVDRNDVRIAVAITLPCLVVIGVAIYFSLFDRTPAPFDVYLGEHMQWYFIMIFFSHILLMAWRRVL